MYIAQKLNKLNIVKMNIKISIEKKLNMVKKQTKYGKKCTK